MSVYKGALTTEVVIDQVKKLTKAFPALNGGFFEVLSNRIKELGFSDDRLKDAISHVIDTCPYQTPSIANFVSFDKRIKLHTYNDMCDMVSEYGRSIWDDYKAVRIPGVLKLVYVLSTDIEVYNLHKYLRK